MKKTIKLNENTLKKIVAESVKKVLKEGTDTIYQALMKIAKEYEYNI